MVAEPCFLFGISAKPHPIYRLVRYQLSPLPVDVVFLFLRCFFVKPYLGAEKDGVLGFGKGMVKGVVGVAIKVRSPLFLCNPATPHSLNLSRTH